MTLLEGYIRGALRHDKRAKIFNDVPGQMPPTLSRQRSNRIILYNGCFNPPHRGHLALLEHAFHHCGEDLNVVAAVILVASEEYLRWKLLVQASDVPFSQAQRVQLWHGEVGHLNWCLVYPEDQWWEVSAKLKHDLQGDGFELEFVRIAGGDKVNQKSQAHGEWSCRKLITSDVCRPVDFFENDAPVSLRGHGPWKKVPVDEEALQERARQHVLYLQSTGENAAGEAGSDTAQPDPGKEDIILAERIREEYLRSLSVAEKRRLWICDCTSNPKGYSIRFIASDEHLDPGISSTGLRDIIAYTPVQELEEKLKGVALSPALLTSFILARYGIW